MRDRREKHCEAKGDGKADDTAAIQKAFDEASGPKAKQHKIVYIPNGTYRLTDTLVMQKGKTGSGLGVWLYGQSRDGVVLKLDDKLKGVKSLLLTHPTDDGKTSANWFFRNVRHVTLDVGDNPTTDGIRYMGNNQSLIKRRDDSRQRERRHQRRVHRRERAERGARRDDLRVRHRRQVALVLRPKRCRGSR